MHVQIGGNAGLDLIQELSELAGAMLRIAAADYRASGDVEGGEGRIGNKGCERSNAWICDFSSTHSTSARSGGAM
jgi:hypothetical protein